MTHSERQNTLDPAHFTKAIQREPDFIAELPRGSRDDMEPEQRRRHLQRAIASGALSLAHERQETAGEYDLDATLYRLVGGIDSFYENSKNLHELSTRFRSPKNMPPAIKRSFYDSKEQVGHFNDALIEVINSGASKFNFNELLTFMTTMHIAGGGSETAKDFHNEARMALIGMRNEVAFEQVLIYSGLDYRSGTSAEDGRGGDYIIEGVPVDIKSSEWSTKKAQEEARLGNYDASRILWSHIDFEDFEGALTLPYHLNQKIWEKIRPNLEKIIPSLQSDRALA